MITDLRFWTCIVLAVAFFISVYIIVKERRHNSNCISNLRAKLAASDQMLQSIQIDRDEAFNAAQHASAQANLCQIKIDDLQIHNTELTGELILTQVECSKLRKENKEQLSSLTVANSELVDLRSSEAVTENVAESAAESTSPVIAPVDDKTQDTAARWLEFVDSLSNDPRVYRTSGEATSTRIQQRLTKLAVDGWAAFPMYHNPETAGKPFGRPFARRYKTNAGYRYTITFPGNRLFTELHSNTVRVLAVPDRITT